MPNESFVTEAAMEDQKYVKSSASNTISGASPHGMMLSIKNLCKSQPKRNLAGGNGTPSNSNGKLQVIDNISFDVEEGEFVTIIGPSGCGKSTLLNIIAGLDTYDSGEITVNGRRAAPYSQDSASGIVIIFQEDALFPWLTVSQNVEFGLKQKKGLSVVERREIVAQYIEMVELTQFSKSFMHELSGGMRQRVAIARGLAMDPRVLLMDEPFGALDARTREGLQREIQAIHQKTKKTILFVTHDIKEAVTLGDRVLLFTKRPARIKREYEVDFPRPRESLEGEEQVLQEAVNVILHEMKEEGPEEDYGEETRTQTRRSKFLLPA